MEIKVQVVLLQGVPKKSNIFKGDTVAQRLARSLCRKKKVPDLIPGLGVQFACSPWVHMGFIQLLPQSKSMQVRLIDECECPV